MSHTLPIPLPWGKGSKAYLARDGAERLIIFVHGFGGGALKTWRGMEELRHRPTTQHTDIVFYGYRSLTAPARNSATLFRNFVDLAASLDEPWRRILRSAGVSPNQRRYREILIVAHSLGAVVSRRALLDAVRLREDWALDTRLLLFGPAHMGTRLVELQAMFKSQPLMFLSDLFTIVRAKMPVLTDLEERSRFLAGLHQESREAIDGGYSMHVASQVVFGERENVVVTDPFCDDPIAIVIANEGHCSICTRHDAVGIVEAELQ